jgi:hypothetical protein
LRQCSILPPFISDDVTNVNSSSSSNSSSDSNSSSGTGGNNDDGCHSGSDDAFDHSCGCGHPEHHQPGFFDFARTDVDFGDKCDCRHVSSDCNGNVLKALECIRACPDFAVRWQLGINSAFALVENAYHDGKENPKFKGTDALEADLRYHIHHQVLHLFDICHEYCDHPMPSPDEQKQDESSDFVVGDDEDPSLTFLASDPCKPTPWHRRKGTVVTCPHQQRQLLWILNKHIMSVIKDLIVPGYGVVNTNISEVVGSMALGNRRKCRLLGPIQLMVKEMVNLLQVQALALGRAGVFLEWEYELMKKLEAKLEITGGGSLTCEAARANWAATLRDRIKASEKRRMESQEIKNALRSKKKRRRKEARRVHGDDYNSPHITNMWDESAQKARELAAKRVPLAPDPYVQCNVCEEWTNQHTSRKCPWEPKQTNAKKRQGAARKTSSKRAKTRPVQPPVLATASIVCAPVETPPPSSLQAFFPEGSLDDCSVLAGHNPDVENSESCGAVALRDWFEPLGECE